MAAPERSAITRALAIHLLHRTGRAFTGAEVWALAPADRRLLRDGIRARRGRASPALNHAQVFSQFSWYEPDEDYTDRRLTDLDRANSSVLDRPPPPETATESEPEKPPVVNEPEASSTSCGCATNPAWLFMGLVGTTAMSRRRLTELGEKRDTQGTVRLC